MAAEREVILVDYAGVGSSTGEPSNTIASTARQMIAFVDALGLAEIEYPAEVATEVNAFLRR